MNIKLFLKKMMKKKMVLFFLSLLVVIILAGIFAPIIAPNDPLGQELENKLLMPSAKYPMGTDHLGRCIFSRVLYATRTTLGFSVICTLMAAIVGITLGIIAGYKGGILDQLIMRTCDVLYAFPGLVLVIAIVGVIGSGISHVIFAMLIVQWMWYARVSRNLAVSEKTKNYVAAAKICGTSELKIIFRHILPNILPNMIAIFTVDFGHTIMSISGYSFLGLGVQAPQPEWGAMISEGRGFINSDPWLMFWPGIMILITVVSVNIIGDHMRDALDSQSI